MKGLVPGRIVHYFMLDGSVRPLLVVCVHPGDTPTQQDPQALYDNAVVDGIIFRNGFNDLAPSGHASTALEITPSYAGAESHKVPLLEWMPFVVFGFGASRGNPGTWDFPPRDAPAPPPPVLSADTFIEHIMKRVQQLLEDHTESVSKILADTVNLAAPIPWIPGSVLAEHAAIPNDGPKEWNPKEAYMVGEIVVYRHEGDVSPQKDEGGGIIEFICIKNIPVQDGGEAFPGYTPRVPAYWSVVSEQLKKFLDKSKALDRSGASVVTGAAIAGKIAESQGEK